MNSTLMKQLSYQSRSGVFSTQLAITSFLGGSILLFLQQLFPGDFLLGIGLAYVSITFLINAAVLLILMFFFFAESEQREYYAIKILILLTNIPVALLYVYITFNFNHNF
jgi:hypothetical protein